MGAVKFGFAQEGMRKRMSQLSQLLCETAEMAVALPGGRF